MSISWENNKVTLEIPSIDGGMQKINMSTFEKEEKAKIDRLVNAPTSVSGRSLLGKIMLGLVIGALMSVMLFVIMSGFDFAVRTEDSFGMHPLSWLIFLFLWFLVSFLGNLALIFLYSIFFSDKYTQVGKTIGLLLLTNTVIFAVMAILFVVFMDNADIWILLFIFYILFSIFISYSQMEFVVNPNYSGSVLIGNTIGFVMGILIFAIMRKGSQSVDSNKQFMLIWFSTLIAFPIMIFGNGIWEVIYQKIYEYGSNPFYIASHAELDRETILERQEEEDAKEAVNVEF